MFFHGFSDSNSILRHFLNRRPVIRKYHRSRSIAALCAHSCTLARRFVSIAPPSPPAPFLRKRKNNLVEFSIESLLTDRNTFPIIAPIAARNSCLGPLPYTPTISNPPPDIRNTTNREIPRSSSWAAQK
jgi:hypothetical protein